MSNKMWVYHKTEKAKIVTVEEAVELLKNGWKDTPAAFKPGYVAPPKEAESVKCPQCKGFGRVALEEPDEDGEETIEVSMDNTRDEIVVVCEKLGINAPDNANKTQLIELIEEKTTAPVE